MTLSLRTLALPILAAGCFLAGWGVSAQLRDPAATQPQIQLQGLSPRELDMLRHDIRQQKQKLIAQNLPMTESEAIKFWAVYQKYADELKALNDEKFAMLHTYSQSWRTMSNDEAMIFMRRWLEVDEKVVQLRSRFLPQFRDALPGKKAATFFQLDERISMMIDLEFAAQLPLLHGRAAAAASGIPGGM